MTRDESLPYIGAAITAYIQKYYSLDWRVSYADDFTVSVINPTTGVVVISFTGSTPEEVIAKINTATNG